MYLRKKHHIKKIYITFHYRPFVKTPVAASRPQFPCRPSEVAARLGLKRPCVSYPPERAPSFDFSNQRDKFLRLKPNEAVIGLCQRVVRRRPMMREKGDAPSAKTRPSLRNVANGLSIRMESLCSRRVKVGSRLSGRPSSSNRYRFDR